MKHRLSLAALVAAFVALAYESALTSGVVIDEFAHLPVGISHLQLGRFLLYRENPPLIRSLFALPAWWLGARVNYASAGTSPRSEGSVAADFFSVNGPQSSQIFLLRARWMIIVLSVGCALTIAEWTGEGYGRSAGIAVAALWLTDPNVVAHSSTATVDIGAALAGLLATYGFWHYLRRPGPARALAVGVGLGLAEASKFSLLVLYPAWMVLAILARRLPDGERGGSARPSWRQLGMIAALSVATLNLVYLGEGTFRPLGSYLFKSDLLAGARLDDQYAQQTRNRFRGTPLASLPVPLPANYVAGLDSQKWDEQTRLLALEGGQPRRGGRWYSPLRTLAYKLPPGTLAILAASAAWWIWRWRRLGLREASALIPAAAILGLLCTQTGLNWPLRYALPALPFLLVAAGGVIRAAWESRAGRLAVVACMVWNAVELAVVRPSYHSYGNPLVGGSAGAQRTFIGSNFDWGQDLVRLKRWCDRHPEAQPLAVMHNGPQSPRDVGIVTRPLPQAFLRPGTAESLPQEPFYWAISSSHLNGLFGYASFGRDGPYRVKITSLLLRPENAGYRVSQSIFIFRIDPPGTPAGRAGGGIAFEDLVPCLKLSDERSEQAVNTP
jgi:dolichyl-phosphate-mannose-protein mannosyltransferase